MSATATLGLLGSKTTSSLALTVPAAGHTPIHVLPPSGLRTMPPQVAASATPLLLVAIERITLQKSEFDRGAVAATGDQVLPPSVEMNMPAPGWGSLKESPVPARRVPLGNCAIALTASDPGNSATAVQVLPPSLLCHSPPPAAPTMRRCAFLGSIQMVLMRPPTLPGPISVQLMSDGAEVNAAALIARPAPICGRRCASILARARRAA